jgi:hypothetical protein
MVADHYFRCQLQKVSRPTGSTLPASIQCRQLLCLDTFPEYPMLYLSRKNDRQINLITVRRLRWLRNAYNMHGR